MIVKISTIQCPALARPVTGIFVLIVIAILGQILFQYS